jgi:hypothetical protein
MVKPIGPTSMTMMVKPPKGGLLIEDTGPL